VAGSLGFNKILSSKRFPLGEEQINSESLKIEPFIEMAGKYVKANNG
jgi:hypothetical protein